MLLFETNVDEIFFIKNYTLTNEKNLTSIDYTCIIQFFLKC